MPNDVDVRASQLHDELASPDAHDPSLRPYREVADALTRAAGGPDPVLNEKTASRQRADLLKRVERLASEPKTAHAIPSPKRGRTKMSFFNTQRESWSIRLRRPLAVLAKTSAPVAVGGLIILLLVSAFIPFLQNRSNGVRQLADLFIPAANAADAFMFTPDMRDAGGVNTTSTFSIETKVDVTAEEVKDRLVLVKAGSDAATSEADFTVEQTGDRTFRVSLAEPLDPGSVYQAKLKTTLLETSGERTERTFAWAFQTKDALRVLSSVPGPNANGVPVNTGIEFTMSMRGWENVTSSFSIRPEVPGRFETHGRTLAFVPEKPLAHETLYTVTLNNGLKIAGSDLTLGKDVTLSFETARRSAAPDAKNLAYVYAADHHVTMIPGMPKKLHVFAHNGAATTTVTGFRLTTEEAKSFLNEEMKIPAFADCTIEKGSVHERFAKTQAFQFSATPYESANNGWWYTPYAIDLPSDIPEGKYVVRLTSKDGQSAWFYLAATPIATYLMSAEDRTLVWTVDGKAEQPIEGLALRLNGETSRTDAQGIGYVKTPAILTSTTTTEGVILEVGEGERTALIPMTPVFAGPYYWRRDWESTSKTTVSFLHIDRPLYHLTDRLEFSGVVQTRNGNGPPTGSLAVVLQRNGYYDYFFGGSSKTKIYKRVPITPDANGFFSGSIDWSNLAPNGYSISIVHDESVLYSQYVDVREFEKPAYTLELTTDKPAYFAGEQIRAQSRAAFFDGTPVAKLELRANLEGNIDRADATLGTDEDGSAPFSFTAKASPCSPTNAEGYCSVDRYGSISLEPTKGEETDIHDFESIQVWTSRVVLAAETKVQGKAANLTYTLRNVTLPSSRDEDALPQDRWPVAAGKVVTGSIVEYWWDRIEDGTRYDPIEKKTFPAFRYEKRSAAVGAFSIRTDGAGKATTSFPMKTDRYYAVIASAKDDRGADSVHRTSVSLYNGAYSPPSDRGSETMEFRPVEPRPDNGYTYNLGERVAFGFFQGENPLPSRTQPLYLYVQAKLGIKSANASLLPSAEFTFSEAHVPNMRFWGVLFRNGGFEERNADVTFNTKLREAKIEITTDKPSYAPGANATARVIVTDLSGKPLPDARVAIAVVDEALFAASWNMITDDPRNGWYRWVSDGIIETQKSHESDAANRMGAEMGGGGGGGDAVRKNFKDTAHYAVVKTNGNGEATTSFKLPDNITSWRVTASAATTDRYGGSATANVPVTKPVFVTAVAPLLLTDDDQTTIKLRAFGTGLKHGEAVEFTVDAPSAGITNAKLAAKAYESAYLPVQKLAPGEYTLTIRVKTAAGEDAFEKRLRVIDSIFSRTEAVRVDIATGTTLGDIGNLPEVDVRIIPLSRAQYIGDLRRLTWSASGRAEANIASLVAANLLKEYFDLPTREGEGTTQETIRTFQQPDGGVSLVRYGSSDPELTSKAAMIAPELFDTTTMVSYFGQQLSGDTAREAQIRAVAGLAALGEPVLIELQGLAALPDLTWREQLAIIGGFATVGDSETANALLVRFLEKGERQDDRVMIRVSNDEAENISATAEAARIAALLVNTNAGVLQAWIRHNWDLEAFTPLDRIGYLRLMVPRAIGNDVNIAYTTGAGNATIQLKQGRSVPLKLMAEEAKAFRIVSADAPAAIAFERPTTQRPTPSKDLTITRTFKNDKGETKDRFAEGDLVTIELRPTIASTAPDGCYDVKDHLPAGLAVFTYGGGYISDQLTPMHWICKGHPRTITYTARVVAKGVYRAEPAVIQHSRTPSVAALTGEQTITIE